MRSRSAALVGVQRPRSVWVPPSVSSSGQEAIECVETSTLELDPWQGFILRESLGERKDGTWSALEVGLEVSRQNGKGGFLEARQLAGLYVLEEKLQVHSAHLFETSLEAYTRLKQLIEECPDFDREVLSMKASHGEEGITLRGGRRIRFKTRTKSGGRGLSGDTLYLDEAMIISQAMHGSLFPIMSARENPQIIYTGSAVDEEQHDDGVVFAKVRARGLKGGDPRLAWLGYGEPDNEITPDSDKAKAMLDDPDAWARANPALGIRITVDYVEAERRALTSRNFAVERLGIGKWPSPEENVGDELHAFRSAWSQNVDREAEIDGVPVLALDVSPRFTHTSISAAGLTPTGRTLIELVDRRRGTNGAVKKMVELVKKHDVQTVVLDKKGTAGTLLEALNEALPFEVTVVTTEEYVQACGGIEDAVLQGGVCHGEQGELDAAVRGATTRPLNDATVWSRKKADADITPLVSGSLAHWGVHRGEEESVWERRAREAEKAQADAADAGDTPEVALL